MAIVGTLKTLVSDLANGNEQLEAKVMSMVLGMWAWGFLVAPLISGQLAEPVKQYRGIDWESHSGAKAFLERFPFLLPNVLGSMLCLVAIALTHFCIQEPLHDNEYRHPSRLMHDIITCLRQTTRNGRKQYESVSVTNIEGSPENEQLEEQNKSQEFEQSTDDSSGVERMSMVDLFSRPQTRSCLLIYWGNSFVTLAIDEMFPLFCISKKSGFGLAEAKIGQILSVSGLLFAFSQYFIHTIVYERYGLYGSIRTGALLVAPTFLFIPFSLLLNIPSNEGELSVVSFGYLCTILALNKAFLLVFFANISVAINRSAPAQFRASLNGLSVVGGSLAKGLGPTFAGFIVTFSVSLLREFGSLLMFGSLCLVALLVAAASFLYLHEESTTEAGNTIELTGKLNTETKRRTSHDHRE